jgi:pimeloyl-ACP methyl ester carboxylesterase
MKAKRLLLAVAVATSGATFFAYVAYLRQRKEALERLVRGSQVVETGRGPVEYASVGEGPAVLVLHGGGGGYDQGALFAWPEWGLRFIAPSRPGYLRTPLWVGHTFEEQADALAAMLNVLEIDQVAVLGMSAGGPPALYFALRHPERCRALVLLSAVSSSLSGSPVSADFVVRVKPSDFFMWLLFKTPLINFLAGRMFEVGKDPEKRSLRQRVLDSAFPFSPRLAGGVNDLRQMAALPHLPLERIAVPTLVIHGDSDAVVPFAQGQRAAEAIPGAQLLILEGGNHLAFVTHLEQSRPALREFLLAHAAR